MSLRFLSLPALIVLFLSSSIMAKDVVKTHTSHAISIHGEPKYGVNATHFDYVNPNAKKGGVFRLSANGTFDSLNAFVSKGNTAIGLGLIYESLTSSSSDEASTAYGLIAERIETAEDNSFAIFHINPQAKFHDGHLITAEDVVFSFNILLEKGGPHYKSYYADISLVEALDTQRAKFTFKNKQNTELVSIVGQLSILPKHFWKDKDFSKANLSIPLGSGPYKISDVKAGKTLTLSRVKNYWAANHLVNKGLYNFDTIVYEYYRDRGVTLEAFKANEYDVRYELTSKTWATGYDFPSIKSGKVKRIELSEELPKGLTGFLMNQRRKTFQDINLRKAMDYAFDYEWTNANIFHNSYIRSNSYFSNSEFASTGILKGRELEILQPYKNKLNDSVFTSFYVPPKTDGKGKNRKNLRVAKKLLEHAGFKIKNNKLIDPETHQPVKMSFLLYDASISRIVNPYIKNLQKLGINATIEMVDQTQYINRVTSFDFDIVMLSLTQSLSPGNEQKDYWGSEAADQEYSRNYIGIQNEVVDKLILSIIKAPSREEQIYRTRALDRVLLSYHYTVPLYYANTHRIAYWDKFKRPKQHAKYDSRYSIGFFTWWIDEDKAKKLAK